MNVLYITYMGFWIFVWAPWFPGAPSGCLPHLLVKSAIGLHCRFSVSVLLHQLWFGSMQGERGEGDNQDPSLQFSLLQYATSLPTPFICMPYTAIWSSEAARCWTADFFFFFFYTKQCATATLHVASLAHANATDITYPQDVCKLCERACNANIRRQSKLRQIQILPEMRNLSACFADGYFYTTTPTLILLLKAMSSAHVKLAASHCSHTEMSRSTAWGQHAWCFTY